jgi:hypothetical protein
VLSSLFLVLLLIAVVALVVGLINPKVVIRWGEEEKRTRGRAALVYGIAIIVLLVAVGISSNNKTQQTSAPGSAPIASTPASTPKRAPVTPAPKPTQPATPAAAQPAQSTPAPQTATANWAQAPVDQNTVTAQIKSFQDASSSLSIDTSFPGDVNNVTVDNGSITIQYYVKDFLDSASLVNESIGTDLDMMRFLFQNKQVNEVEMVTQADMTDQYGKTSPQNGVILDYERNTVNKIDWSGFETRVLSDPASAFNIANSYYIDPGIYKDLKIKDLNSFNGGTDQ